MPQINTPPYADIPLIAVFGTLLIFCVIYRAMVADSKWMLPVAIVVWGVTLLANLILGVIPSLPDFNWLPIAYVTASGVAIGILIATKRSL